MKKIILLLILTPMFLSGCVSIQDNGTDFTYTYDLKNDARYADVSAARRCNQKGYSQTSLINFTDESFKHTRTYRCSNTPIQTYQPPQPTYQQPTYQTPPPPTPGMSIDEGKKKCADLGFKAGTEAFGNCVLKLSK